jgi:catecholate siderophore receptor
MLRGVGSILFNRFAGFILLFLLAGAISNSSVSSGFAQSSAALQGRVLDPSNAIIAGARITAVSDGRSVGLSAVSDESGQFTLSLEPGRYTIKISAKDFLEVSESLEINGGPQSRDFRLHISGARQSVEVRESAGYDVAAISSATKTLTPLRDVPQSISIVPQELIRDQGMMSVADVVRYVPGIEVHQGENNRDQLIIRGNSTSADFFLNGVRDDVQYYRDVYNLERVEALKGPNAMIFGRGGGGGVLNRVTREAIFRPVRAFTLQGGRFGNKRVTGDVDQPLNNKVALRVNGMYENSDSFRDAVGLERVGVNPTLTFAVNGRTRITAAYEYLHDSRVADRGITSYQGRAVPVDPTTYYGNPKDSHVRAGVHLGSALVEHRFDRLTLRNRSLFGDYDRFYQNYVPGATSTDRSTVALTAYNNATQRQNLFNQTDLVSSISTGRIRHTFLLGAEFGRQLTDNFRNTGFFNNSATTLTVPFSSTVTHVPVTYRQSATDADNHLNAKVAATFVQDQVELSPYLQVIGGIRFDRFDLRYHNNRNGDSLSRTDNLVSPRAGLVLKPVTQVSVYGSYSVSYLPSSGDQFSSLTTITQQVKPEKFNNYEGGVKWDVFPSLSIAASGYRLDRTNTRSTDPNDPTRIVQTGSQRTNGFEWSATGMATSQWQIVGGYSYQDAFVTSATTAAPAGAHSAQVPHHTASLWNNYKFLPRASAALGLIGRSEMFATIDNTVTLPGYFRADAALYVDISETVRLQGNLENIFNRRYLSNADSNTNITPGSPRAIRIGLTTRF